MKWYFALNQTSLSEKRELWERLITSAVTSARLNTSLSPHLIYDGNGDPFVEKLRSWGVRIVKHSISFKEAILSHHPENPMYARIAGGAFLRTELPLINQVDELVLYTDCDVMFEKDVKLLSKPTLFACAPEFFQNDFVNFNTGVMLMNLPALRRDFAEFREFMKNNLASFGTFDQDAYRQFYGERVDRLGLTENWKPYWGVNDSAAIVHFHGPKPEWVKRFWNENKGEEILVDIMSWKPDGYRYYIPRWSGYLENEDARRSGLYGWLRNCTKNMLSSTK